MFLEWVLGLGSLVRTHPAGLQGGKSGSKFYVTQDRRFLIKAVARREIATLMRRDVHGRMFEHFARKFWDGQPSLIAQIYGAFRVTQRSGRVLPSSNTYFLVMENLGDEDLYGFDLKGTKRSAIGRNPSTVARFAISALFNQRPQPTPF